MNSYNQQLATSQEGEYASVGAFARHLESDLPIVLPSDQFLSSVESKVRDNCSHVAVRRSCDKENQHI